MKKLLLLLLTVMMLGFYAAPVSAQQIVEIGTGTSTSYNGPFNSLWGYSFVEQIYTSEEIDMAGSITSISFNNSSSGQTNNITVYMKLVNRTSFSSGSDYETVTAADVVYTGSHNFSSGWSTITLDTPFDYDGVSNLMIAVHEYTSGYTTQYFYYTTTTNSMVSFHSDSADPDPYNLGSYGGNNYTSNNRPNVRLEILPSGSNCYAPLSPAVSDVTAFEATLSWTPREGQSAWEVYCGTGTVDLDAASWTLVTDTFYTFTSLTPATNYTAYVRSVCDAEVSNPRQVPFTTEATCVNVPSAVTVSNITATTAEVNWAAGEDDYAWEVVVVPANEIPENGTIEQTSDHPYTLTNLSDNTQYKVYVRTDCGGGDHSYWSTPATFTTLPHCSSPLNVKVSQITANSALVTWQPAVYGATSYVVEYSLASEENWTVTPVDGTQLMLTDLEPDSTYNVMVYSICDLGTADTIQKSFITRHCLVGGDLQIGEGTNTTNLFPTNSCYNYSYTQQIFLASEMNGAANINSIAFDVTTINSTPRNISIYMMHTTAASSDWLPATTAQLVYTGSFNLVLGWNTITFTAPFQYNGTDNLALIMVDATGSYSCSNYYNCHTASATLAQCQYQDTDPYSINSIPTSGYSSGATAERCNVIFGVDCNEDVTCVRPNVYVTETSPSSVTLDWAPGNGESTWEVEYSVDNSTWEIAGTANTHPYEVSNLNVDTRYYFRVRSNCGGEVSDWSVSTARTECGPVVSLPYFNNFDEVISDNGTNFVTCWNRYTTNPQRVVRCYGSATHSGSYALDFNYSPSCTTAAVTPMIDPSIPLNTLMLDFWAYSSLGQGWMEVGTMSDPTDFSTYEFYDTVRLSTPSTWENVMISLENYTGSNQYIAFLEINGTSTSYIFDDFTIDYIPSCVHPNNLTVDGYTNSTVTLSWTELGNASTWAIEYGPAGFTPGEGTLVTTYDNPFTVEDLTPATAYDFYVYSDCGGFLSDPFGPVSAIPGQYIFGVTGSDTLTTCGVLLYDDGGANGNYSSNCNFTLVLYPENPDAMMSVIGTLTTESISYDYLTIYDGVGTATQLAKIGGSSQTVNVMSQSGPLTLVFHSDGSVVYSGFEITASCVTCFPPTNIIATDQTTDGATLSWSGVGDSYVLFLDGDMTTGYDAFDTTYTFTGLNSSSIYSVQIASICNGDTSMLSSAASFSTGCDAVTITEDNPWTEDFESYPGSGAQMFVCWETPVTEVVDNGTSPFVYCGYGQSCHSGQNSAELKGTSNMLVLPEFTNDLATLRMSFWATTTSTSNPGSVDIGYITDVTDPTTFVSLTDAGTPGPRGGSNAGNGNYMGPFNFSGVTAAGARIALRFNGLSGLSWNLDDFTVELAPSCTSPVKTSVTASNIGGHVATISWVDNDESHSAWTVFYKKSTESDWNTVPAFDTTVTLTGLDPLSIYDVYVITDCGTTEANPDATHTIHFTTTVACPAPTGLTLTSVSTDEATITWNGTASSYNVEYGETGFTLGNGIIDVTYTESFTMTNLDPSTSYTIYVNSDCTDNNDSLSSTVSFTFTTTQVPTELPYTTDFTTPNEWILNNGTCTNYWTVGTIDSISALFVTNNGTAPGYNVSSTSIVSAEKLLTVGNALEFTLSFDVRVGGESSWDYLKVFLAPATSEFPAATSAPDFASYSYSTNAVDFSNYLSMTGYSSYPYKLNLTNGNTIHVEVTMPNPNANAESSSTAKLVFLWKNDASSGTQPGAVISNVSVSAISCPTPSSFAVSNGTSNSVTLTWNTSDDMTSWEIAYGPIGFDPEDESATIVTAYTNTLDIQNLDPATTYEFFIRSICGASEFSNWSFPLTYTTECLALTAPYTEDFNSYSTTVTSSSAPSSYPNDPMPLCWSFLNRSTSSSSYPQAFLTGYSAYSVSGNCLFFKSSSTDPLYAILPSFTDELNTLQITFNYRNEGTGSSNGTLSLGYMTNPSDASTFTEINSYPQITTVTEITEVLSNIPAEAANGNLVFKYTGGSNNNSYLSLDNIFVEVIPTCPKPSDVAVSAITQTTASVSWTENGEATSWNIKVNDGTNETIVSANTNPFTLTNLDPATMYTVSVQSVCGASDMSLWSNEALFATMCNALSVPYTENFDIYTTAASGTTTPSNYPDDELPLCWTFLNRSLGSSSYPQAFLTSSSTYAVSGNCLFFKSSTSNPLYAILPEFTDNIQTLMLYFTYRNEGTGTSNGTLSVGYMTNLGDATTFTEVSTFPQTTTLTTDTVDFSDVPTTVSNAFIVFKYTGGSSNNYYLSIDNVGVNLAGSGPIIPTDPTVTTGAASNIAQTTATLNGTINNPDNVTITAKGFEWKTSVGGTYTPVTVTGNNLTYNLTNLTANTGYTYKAFITFNGTTIYGDEVTFTTLEQGQLTEPSATTTPATNVTQTTATLNGAISNPDNVTITAQGFEWKAASASSYTVLNATGTTMSSTLNNLTANTNYTYRAFVTTANGTHYGSDVTFTTLEEIPEPCNVPTNLHTTTIQNEAIAIAWDADANVTSWNIQYRPVGGSLTTATSNTNSYTITGLTGLTTYEIQVQANCGDGNLSDWTAAITPQTTNVGIANYLENSVVLFPNPANEYINVQSSKVTVQSVEVIDVYGKVINTVNVTENPTRINVHGLASGMYFVRVTTDEGVATKTFIKK